jgi:2-pyrone-4,6-dicarboxylate lactonase
MAPSAGNPAPHPDPRRPKLNLPALSCDAHCHVFGPTSLFPYADDRTFTPAEATVQDVVSRQRFLGFERAVIVQSSCYGTDHRGLLNALRGDPDRLRGVAILTPDVSAGAIEELHEAGVRGARLNFLPHLGTSLDPADQEVILAGLADRGWHAEIHVHSHGISEHRDMIASIRTPVVIDHMARLDLASGLDGPDVQSLLRLMDTGNVWVKLSGADRVSIAGAPYDDAVELAALLARHAPERVLWGTDFPHPNIDGVAPDDGLLVDLIGSIAPSERARQLLLVDNPAEFFGFQVS